MFKKVIASIFLFVPSVSFAHSFGNLYSLPVPFWLYLYGGAGAVLVSFLVFGYFLGVQSTVTSDRSINLSQFGFFRFLTSSFFLTTLQVFSFTLFLLTVFSGLLGENSFYSNFNVTFFWVICMLGLTYFTALFGNIYSVLNPWKILSTLIFGKDESAIFKYPEKLGYYPALIFYFILIWIELVGQSTPFSLSLILVVYTIINNFGVVFFGSSAWFKYCEFFSVFWNLVGKVSPFTYKDRVLAVSSPWKRLAEEKAESFSHLLFVLFMLSSTAFDGFKETIHYSALYREIIEDVLKPWFGVSSYKVFETVSLFLSLFVFLGIYLLLMFLSKKIIKSEMGIKELSFRFVFSLLPIAVVYNVAHYYTLIFTESFSIVRLFSDPFGFGWNLFGTADFYKSIIIPANILWHSQVGFILVGHIISVYIAHKVSLTIFMSRKGAIFSQLPVVALMIIYTMIGLWILSQPLTGGVL